MLNINSPIFRFLRWTERYTKTDMVYLASGGFWLTIGQFVSSLSALALAVAFANLVPPETYGTYKYILSIAGIFAIFTLPGMNTAITRVVAQGHESMLLSSTHSRVLFSFIGTLVALAGSGYYFYNGNVELSLSLLIIAVTLPIFDTFTGYLAHFAGKRRFDLQTRYHIVTQLISVATLITILFITNNVLFILLAYFFPLSLTRFVLFRYTLKKNPQTTDTIIEKEALTYGKHLTVMQILGTVAGQIDKFLIWHFLGPAEVAIYAFALAIPEQLKGPLKGVGELALPKFAAQTPEQIRMNMPALWRKLALYALTLFSISLVYILVAPYIFQVLFPQYMESVVYSQVFMLASFALIGTIPITILSAQQKVKEQYIFSIVQPTLQTLLFVIGIPLFGIWGAIFARVIMRILYIGLTFGIFYTSFREE